MIPDWNIAAWYSDSGWLGLLLAVTTAVIAFYKWGYRLIAVGHNGRNELISIYRKAIQSTSHPRLQTRALELLQKKDFVDILMMPQKASHADELDAFRHRLTGSTKAEIELDRFIMDLSVNLLEGLRHSTYPVWQQRYRELSRKLDETQKQPSTPSATPDTRTQACLFLGLLNSKTNLDAAAAGSSHYFSHRKVPIPRFGDKLLAVSGEGVESDPAAWRNLIRDAYAAIRKAESHNVRLHLTQSTKVLWSFALGTILVNRYPLVLYHYEIKNNESYHKIWQMDRNVKNLRSPRENSNDPDILNVEWTEISNSNSNVEALVLSLGANCIGEKVARFLKDSGQAMSQRVVTKRISKLDPDKPDDWIKAAAEIGRVIDRSLTALDDLYLFADMPAVLALMVGDSLGPYQGRIHLMQWVLEKQEYVEVLTLPDPTLNRMVG